MAHIDKNSKIIRLVYVSFEKFYNRSENPNIEQACFWSKQFQLPNRMSLNDACKVISFLSESIDKENCLAEGSLKGVVKVSNVLEQFGFKAVAGTENASAANHCKYNPSDTNICFCEEVEGVVDLITYAGQARQFKKSDISSRYFDWFIEGVKKDEVKQIYNACKTDNEDENDL